MKGPYSASFANPFRALLMSRPAYKAQAQYSLRAVTEAALGTPFGPLLAALDTAITGFDENLADRNQSTTGGTEAFHEARAQWLEFVDDTTKDYVTPKLRKLPIYADFKKFGKSKLAALSQPAFITQANALLQLYTEQQSALRPALGTDAKKLYDALVAADKTRDTQGATIDSAILDLADDRAAIAHAQRRLKAQLELTFEDPAKVYSYFDFSASKAARKSQPKPPAQA